jgi:septum formation protein
MTAVDISPKAGLWAAEAPLLLASKSAARRALLEAAGLRAEVVAAKIDERANEDRFFAAGGRPSDLAVALAQAKALSASRARPEAYCLGADQTLILGDRLLHKPCDLDQAAQLLAALADRTHRLSSAFSVARAGKTLVVDVEHANLQMRALDRRTIEKYLELAAPAVLSSVGAYHLEGLGVHLFDRVEGDFATILGIPMFKLLAWFRREGLISL